MYWNDVILFPVIWKSSKFAKYKQLQNIMRNGFIIGGQLSFNILTEKPS